MTIEIPAHELIDDTKLPAIGFGTFPLKREEGVTAITSALECGYRLLDTAVNYENEREVGEALRNSGVDRDDVVVQTKIPGRDHEFERAVASVEGSLDRLGLDRVDVALIHWPNPSVDKYVEAWRALVRCRERGLVRSIGVSNFTADHLDRVIDDSGVTPAVNQIELHPWFPQQQMRDANAGRGVLTQSWSPLGKRQAPFGEDAVVRAAEHHGVSPGQVVLRWQVQLGALPLPKSATPERQRENLDVFSFALTDDELAAISGLAKDDGRLFGADPRVHEEM